MRRITTTAGTPVETDGDVLAILEAVSRDLARRADLDYSFEEIDHEIQHLIGQLSEEELRTYLKESLFMSFNRYENDRLSQLVKKAAEATDTQGTD
jgi:phage gp29-like protein